MTPTPALVRIRDYAAEMRDIIDQRTQAVSYNAAEVADEIVQHLLHEDRELLYGWLEGHAAQTIRTAIAQRDASTRAYARTHAPKAAFAEAANAAKGGDPQPLRLGFLQAVYVCAADNTRKALKDMTAADVLYVADSYEGRAKQALLEAAFLRAVAKKIGAGRVADVFNNQQLAELRTKLGAD